MQNYKGIVDCEERLMNAWPAHQTVVIGDWLCRMAKGYSGRANSACLIRPKSEISEGEINYISALYRENGLRPSFRMTPLAAPGIVALLAARGMKPEDGSLGMIGDAPGAGAIPPGLQLETQPTQSWLEGACRWQSEDKQNSAHLLGIVGNIRIPVRFGSLVSGGKGVAYGMVALDRGMAEIGAVMVDPAWRGEGLGRALVGGLFAWASSAGAKQIFLQVGENNSVATKLYESFGLKRLYEAAYWRPAS